MANAAQGYFALKKQTNATTPVTPDVYVPYYSQNIVTNQNYMADTPVVGNLFRTFQHLRGTRSHTGPITTMAEPDTIARLFDMTLVKGTTTGSAPYTHPFTYNGQPSYYTGDLSFGNQVVRFWGMQSQKIGVVWDEQKMQAELDTSSLGSFYGREIASVSTVTITLKTDYDAEPTKGLVVGDLVKLTNADGSTTLNTAIDALTATTVTLDDSAASFAEGDVIVLRPATPDLTIKRPFLWGLTQYYFSDTAANALTASATASNQTRLEPDTTLELMYDFNESEGEKRSGSFDPAALLRTVADYAFTKRQYFDTPEEFRKWQALEKQALVMRSYSGDTNQYELRVTLNNMNITADPITLESAGVIYHEQEFGGNYDQTDGQGFDVKVINSQSTI